MFTPGKYREKAIGYGKLVKTASGPNERREFQELEQDFTVLADNEQWLAGNHDRTVRTVMPDIDGTALAHDEEHILRCLGGALILQWNTLPRKLRRELFDNARTTGELLETAKHRGKIARIIKNVFAEKDHPPSPC